MKFVILQQVYVISLLLLQILAAIGNYQYSRMRILHITFEFLSAFYKIDKFVTGPFETCLWSHHCYFLNKQGIQVCVVSNFYPGWEKMSIMWKIWNFHPVLKFHLGLAKPSWNFNSVYRIEFFTCNFFFLSGFSFTDTDDWQDNSGREGGILHFTLPLPPSYKHWDFFCNFACEMTITYF